MEVENTDLKSQLKALEEKTAIMAKSLSPGEQKKGEELFEAKQKILHLEQTVKALEQERIDLRSQNAQLRKNNRELCEKALQQLQDDYESKTLISTPKQQSTLASSIAGFGFKVG